MLFYTKFYLFVSCSENRVPPIKSTNHHFPNLLMATRGPKAHVQTHLLVASPVSWHRHKQRHKPTIWALGTVYAS